LHFGAGAFGTGVEVFFVTGFVGTFVATGLVAFVATGIVVGLQAGRMSIPKAQAMRGNVPLPRKPAMQERLI
jgi:hypothetical protein